MHDARKSHPPLLEEHSLMSEQTCKLKRKQDITLFKRRNCWKGKQRTQIKVVNVFVELHHHWRQKRPRHRCTCARYGKTTKRGRRRNEEIGLRVLNCTKRRWGTNRTALVCIWNTRLPAFSELLRDSFLILQSNEHLRSVFDFPLVSYRRPRNLRDLVSPSTEQSRKARAPQPDGTFPCDRPRYKTCERVHSIATLPNGADRSISIRGHHSCQSASVVYPISCTQAQCDAVYIGETGCTLRERMNGHRSSI